MTTPRDLLKRAEALFLDFDGPVAALMPPPVNQQAAVAVRRKLIGIDLPTEIERTSDHLAVLKWTRANCDEEALVRVEAACTEAEVAAAQTCERGVHAASLLQFAARRDIPVAVVSNNSDVAVRRFLLRAQWLDQVDAFACRTPHTVDWLKPSPRLVQLAGDALGIDVSCAVFVGDAVSDVIAAKAAGVPIIALAKNQERAIELAEAGADVTAELSNEDSLRLDGLGRE